MEVVVPKIYMYNILNYSNEFINNNSTNRDFTSLCFKHSSEDYGVDIIALNSESGILTKSAFKLDTDNNMYNVLVNADKLLQILRSFPDGNISIKENIKVNSNNLTIVFYDISMFESNITTKHTLKTSILDKDSFTNYFEGYENNNKIVVKSDDLLSALKVLIKSASVLRLAQLNSVSVIKRANSDVLELAASDSRKFSISYISLDTSSGDLSSEIAFVVPVAFIVYVLKVLSTIRSEFTTIYYNENKIFIEYDNVVMFSNLIDIMYPNYTMWVGKVKEFKDFFSLKADDFINAIKRVTAMKNDQEFNMLLEINDKSMSLKTSFTDIGESVDTVQVDTNIDKKFYIYLNYKFLLDILSNIERQSIVTVYCVSSDPLQPICVVDRGNTKTVHILISIRPNTK